MKRELGLVCLVAVGTGVSAHAASARLLVDPIAEGTNGVFSPAEDVNVFTFSEAAGVETADGTTFPAQVELRSNSSNLAFTFSDPDFFQFGGNLSPTLRMPESVVDGVGFGTYTGPLTDAADGSRIVERLDNDLIRVTETNDRSDALAFSDNPRYVFELDEPYDVTFTGSVGNPVGVSFADVTLVSLDGDAEQTLLGIRSEGPDAETGELNTQLILGDAVLTGTSSSPITAAQVADAAADLAGVFTFESVQTNSFFTIDTVLPAGQYAVELDAAAIAFGPELFAQGDAFFALDATRVAATSPAPVPSPSAIAAGLVGLALTSRRRSATR